MGFKEDLQKLSIQINERRVDVNNEETTKQSLILPFFRVLGFDIHNPLEISPEYIADFGKKKGEKVDYVVFKDSVTIMFFEAKSVNERLVNHDAQLSRYFNSTQDVGFGIITNGIEYRFFTDLVSSNIMDDKPFLVVDMTNLKESDFEKLVKFKKELFDKESLVRYAEELVYTSALDDSIKELLKNPNDKFIKFLIKGFDISRITSNIIDKFRPIVKKSISNAVLDIVSKGLLQQEVIIEKVDIVESAKISVSMDAFHEIVFELKNKKAIGKMAIIENKCVVLKGSTAVLENRQSITSPIAKLRADLIETGIMVNKGDGVYTFLQDATFNSPSHAATAIVGGTANGRQEWKHNGKCLSEVEGETIAIEPEK